MDMRNEMMEARHDVLRAARKPEKWVVSDEGMVRLMAELYGDEVPQMRGVPTSFMGIPIERERPGEGLWRLELLP